MAFEMYANKYHEKIDHHEEILFHYVNDHDENYPSLYDIWENFYNGPRFSPEFANNVVHELILLLSNINEFENKKAIQKIILRLLPFFSFAYKNNYEIKCSSD